MSVDLGKFELLQELSEEQREALGDALSESTLEPDQALFHCRDEASELHLICEGGVRLEVWYVMNLTMRIGEPGCASNEKTTLQSCSVHLVSCENGHSLGACDERRGARGTGQHPLRG